MESEICVLEQLETEVTAESTLEFESKQVAKAVFECKMWKYVEVIRTQ